jgi:DNA topoisomerase-6 subunit B
MASVWVPFTSESKEAIADYDEIRKEMTLAIRECGRKLGSYIRRRRRQKLEADKRSIFTRYIPDVAEALANLTGADEDGLIEKLELIAKERTAQADEVLDEDGKPIAQPEAADAFANDDSTVIIAENEAAEVPEDLFDSGNGSNGSKPKTRKRKRR